MPDSADTHPNGTVAAGISNAVVKILHEYTGRGPTKARTDINPNSVLVMLADTLTKGERVLVDGGKSELVLRTREQFQQLMRDDLVAAVEGLTQRNVIAFMSENHIDPDMAAEIFVLEPADDEASAADRKQPERTHPADPYTNPTGSPSRQ
jgi:uncharacterized protein YbcI